MNTQQTESEPYDPLVRETIIYFANRPQNPDISAHARRLMFVVPIQLLFRGKLNCIVQAEDIAEALTAFYEPEDDFITPSVAAWVMRRVFQDSNHVVSGGFTALQTSEGYQFSYNNDCLEDVEAIAKKYEQLRTAA